ncbi:MAG: dipeptidase [Armatimonadetes bacterium]|nr:dipeptidase [Akkermansiaceae bacterium]
MTSELQDLFAFLSFPSVSTDSKHKADLLGCAAWLVEKLSRIGLDTDLHETPGHPIVIARNAHVPGKKTVLIYGHYDVQPPDPLNLWDSPPFTPVIRDGKIWARGATDNKGQMLAHILGIEKTLREKAELPVNIILMFEGEEEIGSPCLAPFLMANRNDLKCDIIAISDTGMVAPNTGTLGYGLRGIACAEIKISGPARDLHSGLFGGAVANPATAAAQLVASLHHPDGTVAIKGFYDEVRPLEKWEHDMWAQVPGVTDQDFLDVTGSPSLFGEPGYTSAERTWARPTVEVNGIGGGYQGEGSKTVLPAEAFVKFSLRLVPDQDPGVILQKLTKHLEAHCPAGVRLEIMPGHSGKPYVSDPHSHFGKAAQRALGRTFPGEPMLIREGGSIPIVQAFREILGVDSLLLGLALADAQIHSPNENFPIANFEAGIRLNQALLEELAH